MCALVVATMVPVAAEARILLLAAGGGGGATPQENGANASFTTSGTPGGGLRGGAGGANGSGGSGGGTPFAAGPNGGAGGGAGVVGAGGDGVRDAFGSGGASFPSFLGGDSPIGTPPDNARGGFGGGGGAGAGGAGGGGGYSGGGGGSVFLSQGNVAYGGGGGGGSFISGLLSAPFMVQNPSFGNGFVQLRFANPADTIAFGYTGTFATYTSPISQEVSIEARGAQGGAKTDIVTTRGGSGALVRGRLNMNAGDELRILVGGAGGAFGFLGGGGGGSFVWAMSIPEPSVWGMFLAGVAMIGWARHRVSVRRPVQANVAPGV